MRTLGVPQLLQFMSGQKPHLGRDLRRSHVILVQIFAKGRCLAENPGGFTEKKR